MAHTTDLGAEARELGASGQPRIHETLFQNKKESQKDTSVTQGPEFRHNIQAQHGTHTCTPRAGKVETGRSRAQ